MEQKLTRIPDSFKNLVARYYGYKSYTDIEDIKIMLKIHEEIRKLWKSRGAQLYNNYTPEFTPLETDPDLIFCGFGDHFAMHVEETPDSYTIRAENRVQGFLDEKLYSGFLDFPAKTLTVKRLGVITWFLSQGTPKHLIVAKRLSEIYFSSETPAAALSNNIPATLDKLRK